MQPRVEHVLGMGTLTDDFNCWGATMFVAKATPTLAWVEYDEIGKWLTDNYSPIRRAQVEEGDIVALFSEDMRLIHTAYALDKNHYVHKMGRNVARLESLNKVLQAYARDCKKFIFLRSNEKCV